MIEMFRGLQVSTNTYRKHVGVVANTPTRFVNSIACLLVLTLANIMICDFTVADYVNLKRAFSVVEDYTELTACFLSLCTYYPLLTLHYANFLLLVKPHVTEWVGFLPILGKNTASLLVHMFDTD